LLFKLLDKNLILIIMALSVLLPIDQVVANDINNKVFVNFDTRKVELSPYVEILVDDTNSLTIDDIINKEGQYKFESVTEIGNSFGFSNASYWVRLSVELDNSFNDTLLLQLDHPSIDNVAFFCSDGKGGFETRVTGEYLPHATREIDNRVYLFHLSQQSGEIATYYLQLQTEGSMQIPLTLWASTAYIEHIDTSNIFLGIYYGIMLLLIAISLASFVNTRDKLFLWYVFYLISYLLFQLSMNGFAYQYLWPELPQWSSRITAVSAGFVGISALAFSGVFLQIWGDKHPYIKRLYFLLIIVNVIAIVMGLFGDYSSSVQLLTFLGMLMFPVIFIAAMASMLSGYKPARYFFAAWTIYLIGVFIQGLLLLGMLPHMFLTLYAMQIGSMIEIVLLGYALMMKIDLLRMDKNFAQAEANKYLNQLNEELGSLVDERTQELQVKNIQLSKLVSLDSMTGLLNHNASIDLLNRLRHAVLRYDNDLAVIMLDIDFFKSINDQFGHPAGDKVIISIANILKETIRDSDGAGRYGGEEFILILPETNINAAKELAERIRQDILQLDLDEIDNKKVTSSFGLAVFEANSPESNLIDQADSALYKAKEAGRNCIKVFESVS